MDKKYLEEQMSAYLDGELSPGEISKYEQEIQAYPELFAELQTLQRLNKLAGSSKLTMPDDRYFENLASRIDEGVANQPVGKARIIEFILAKRKSVTIISSVAAVLLVVLIGMNMFGPDAKRYPNQLPAQRSIESPAVLEHSDSDTSAPATSVDLKSPPAPEIEEAVRDRKQEQNEKTRVIDAEASKKALPMLDTGAVPATMPVKEIEKPVTADEVQRIPPSVKIKPGQVERKNMSGESSGAVPKSLSTSETQSSQIASSPMEAPDTVIIFAEPISPSMLKSFDAAPAISKSTIARTDIPHRQDSSGLSWDIYRHVFKELDQGVYDGWKLTAPSEKLDSLRAWKDSLNVLGPSRWYAEQAFRSLLTNQITWDEYQRMRAYIDHYTAETQIPDSAVWNRRLPIVNEIYERQIGKQYREKNK